MFSDELFNPHHLLPLHKAGRVDILPPSSLGTLWFREIGHLLKVTQLVNNEPH